MDLPGDHPCGWGHVDSRVPLDDEIETELSQSPPTAIDARSGRGDQGGARPARAHRGRAAHRLSVWSGAPGASVWSGAPGASVLSGALVFDKVLSSLLTRITVTVIIYATYFVHIWGEIQHNSKTNLGAVCAKLTPRPSWVCVENHVDPGTPSMWAYVPAEGSSTRDPRRHLNRSRCRDRSVVSTR